MKNDKLRQTILFVCAAGMLGGCANGDIDTLRRSSDEYMVNGNQYASSAENESNVFGQEGMGISEDDWSKPSADLLQKAESEGFSEFIVTAVPEKAEAFINEMVTVRYHVTGVRIEEGEDGEEDSRIEEPAEKISMVVMLDTNSGNGSLAFGADTSTENVTTNSAVVQTDETGSFEVRVATGTIFNPNKPMYYLHLWNAVQPSSPIHSVAVNVKRPKTAEDLDEGSRSTVNDMTPPDDFANQTSELTDAELKLSDSAHQELYCEAVKELGVQVTGKKSSDTANKGEVAGANEPICWTFVTGENASQKSKVGYVNKRSQTGGCATTDANGKFSVTLHAGELYDAKYYLNFFHPNATAVTYDILTFALPDSLGTVGEEATIDPDGDGTPGVAVIDKDGNKIDGSSLATDKNGNVSEENSKKIIESIFDPKSEPGATIHAECAVISEDCEKICGAGSAICSANPIYICHLHRNDDGTWSIQKCDGSDVKADYDGDGNKDTGHLIIDKDGDSISYNGVDLDGDGKSDVAPEYCDETKTPDLCDEHGKYDPEKISYKIVWSGNEKKTFGNRKISMPTQSVLNVFLKALDQDSKGVSNVKLEASLIAGADPKTTLNDGFMTTSENDPYADTTLQSTDKEGVTDFWFNSGTAYDARYYVELSNAKAKTVYLPIETTNSVKLPGGEGDAADESEANKRPDDMPDKKATLGKCYLSIGQGDEDNIQQHAKEAKDEPDKIADLVTRKRSMDVSTIKTLSLQARLYCSQTESKEPTVKDYLAPSNEKTYWKLTRGPSSYNNATLTETINITDASGLAKVLFYTGTGYGSLYYVSIFHPNAEEPAIYTITTSRSSGSVPGVDENDDPIVPSLDDVEKDETLPEGMPCSDACIANPANCPRSPECEANTENCTSADKCLFLTFEESSPYQVYTGKTARVKAYLMMYNPAEDTSAHIPVRSELIWTLNANEGADAALASETTKTNSKGRSTAYIDTGSVATTYKVNVMHPNINDGENMIPVSLMMTVLDKSQIEKENAEKYRLNLNVEGATNTANVKYYVMSADYNRCNANKALSSGSNFCETAAGPSEWKSWKNSEDKSIADSFCGISAASETGDAETGDGVDVELPDGKSLYMVYAIETDDKGTNTKYACLDGFYMPSAQCYVDEDGIRKCEEVTKSVTLSLEDIPISLGGEYYTKSLIDVGPLIDVPEDESECSGRKDIGCVIAKVHSMYSEIITSDPGQKVIDTINAYIFQTDDTSNGTQCLHEGHLGEYDTECYVGGALAKKLDSVSPTYCYKAEDRDYKNGKKLEEGKTTCLSNTDGFTESAVLYKKSDCVCAKMYHYTGYNEKSPGTCPTCSKTGPKVKQLLEKLLKNLINKAFDAANIEDNLCKLVDPLQYIEFNGKLNIDTSKGASMVGVNVNFTGATIPLTDTKLDLQGRAVTGSTKQGIVEEDAKVLVIPSMNMVFSYGLLVYDIIGKLLPKGAIRDGVISFENILKCSSLFGIGDSGIKIPVIGGSISPALIDTVCATALQNVSTKTLTIAEQQYTSLNISLSGSGEYGCEGGCSSNGNGGLKANVIRNGYWSGKGTLSGKSGDITGLWVAAEKDGKLKSLIMQNGTQSVDEYMAANSICRKTLTAKTDEEIANVLKKDLTNKACLKGSYDVAGRVKNNYCGVKDGDSYVCNGGGIVVCKDGKLNPAYAAASVYKIITDANQACIGNSHASCSSSEIINSGNGWDNTTCFSHCEEQEHECITNISIAECAKENGDTDIIVKEQSKANCVGHCDEAECIMNSDVMASESDYLDCKTKSTEADNTTTTDHIVAMFDFSGYEKNGSSQFVSNLSTGIKSNGCTIQYEGSDRSLVAGRDGNVGAIGWNTPKKAITITCSCQISKVTAFIKGIGREISYGSNDKILTSENAWEMVSGSGNGTTYTFEISDHKSAVVEKLSRIDDITVYSKSEVCVQ